MARRTALPKCRIVEAGKARMKAAKKRMKSRVKKR